MQTGKALLTKYLLTTQSSTPFGNTQSAHSREAQCSWAGVVGLLWVVLGTEKPSHQTPGT